MGFVYGARWSIQSTNGRCYRPGSDITTLHEDKPRVRHQGNDHRPSGQAVLSGGLREGFNTNWRLRFLAHSPSYLTCL